MGEDESKSRNLKGKILVSMQSIESYILTHPRLEMIEPSIALVALIVLYQLQHDRYPTVHKCVRS